MDFTLPNIMKVLHTVFTTQSWDFGDKTLVMAIGNTGCGKSTMFNSLAFGTKSLEVKRIKQEKIVRHANGDEKARQVRSVTVIDQRDSESAQVFRIGHSNNQSMTFLPHIVPCQNEEMDFIFADIAGFNDTGGSLIELVNCFIDKQIFRAASKVKILVPITSAQITESRGMEARNQIAMLQRICRADIEKMIHSVQPLLTKMRVSVASDVDIDTLRAALVQQSVNEIETQKKNSGGNEYEQRNLDKVLAFCKDFAAKLEVFDPLNRKIQNEDEGDDGESIAITREELIQELNEMPSINGSDLNVPMTNTLFMRF